MDFDMTAEDIKVFLDEAEEQLQVMESSILKLEKEADKPEHLQEIFRAAHTLKGSSATLGHKQMAEVTHAMENVLDKLRKGKLTVSTRVVDTLFSCLDVLQAYKEEIATGQASGVKSVQILARLSAIDEQRPAQQATATHDPVEVPDDRRIPNLTPQEREMLASAEGEGRRPVWVELSLKGSSMPSVRAFQALLVAEDLGLLVRSWPNQSDVERDQVGSELKLLIATAIPPDVVRETFAAVPEVGVAGILSVVSSDLYTTVVDEAAAAVLEAEDATHAEPISDRTDPNSAGGRHNKNASRTVRVDVEALDNLMSLVGELVIDRTRLLQVLTRLETEREDDDLTQIMSSALGHIGRMTSDLQEEIQRARMLPVDNLFRKFPRMVRDTAMRAGKDVEFVVLGEETELDRSVIEEIGDPLMHLLRNAIDHGVEPSAERSKAGKSARGTVTLEAFHEENHIIISVRDDGRGIDPEKLRVSAVRKGLISEETIRRMPDEEVLGLVWVPGFSTAEKVSDISGRGVGLDVVQRNIEKLNGSVEIKSKLGKGTEFRVKLPLTLAIIRSLQVQVLGTTYCLPLSSVLETDRIDRSEVQTLRQREVIVKRGEVIPLLHLIDTFDLQRPEGEPEPVELFVVIVSVAGAQIGIIVDGLIGEGDVVIKPLGKFIGDVPGISGATILGDGDVAVILDISTLVNSVQIDLNREEAARR